MVWVNHYKSQYLQPQKLRFSDAVVIGGVEGHPARILKKFKIKLGANKTALKIPVNQTGFTPLKNAYFIEDRRFLIRLLVHAINQ
jgi:hypothetical protein